MVTGPALQLGHDASSSTLACHGKNLPMHQQQWSYLSRRIIGAGHDVDRTKEATNNCRACSLASHYGRQPDEAEEGGGMVTQVRVCINFELALTRSCSIHR